MDFNSSEARLAKELGVPRRCVCIVGSTLICGGGNDVDFLCLVPAHKTVTVCGFVSDTAVNYESSLHSFRRGGQNVIATVDEAFFFSEVAIAHAARLIATDKFNMSNRDDRIRFHGAVRDQVQMRMMEEFV